MLQQFRSLQRVLAWMIFQTSVRYLSGEDAISCSRTEQSVNPPAEPSLFCVGPANLVTSIQQTASTGPLCVSKQWPDMVTS